MHHQRCEMDRRSVRVRLTEKGREVRDMVEALFERHAEGLLAQKVIDREMVDTINIALRRVERYWTDQIRYVF